MKTLKNIGQMVAKLYAKAKDPDERELDHREAYPYIRSASAKIMQQNFFQFYTPETREIPAHYQITYEDVEVKLDERGRCYSEIPADYLMLPKNLGLREILPVSKKDVEVDPMVIMSQEYNHIMKRLDAGSLDGEFAALPRRDKVYFTKSFGKSLFDKGITKVDITLLATTPENVGENDKFTLPEEYHNQVIMEVFSIFAGARASRISMDDVRELQQDLERRE